MAVSESATARCPPWLPPLSPMRMMFVKPCTLSECTMSVRRARKVPSRMLMVPGLAMCPLTGSIPPSGTNFTIGAQSALPSLRAIASQLACST